MSDDNNQNIEKAEEEVEGPFNRADDDEYFTAYSNGTSIAHTFFDVQFHFSEVKIRDTQHVDAQTFATVIMSPQHAKLFLLHLTQNLELYETKFGEIKVPENLIQQTKTIDLGSK